MTKIVMDDIMNIKNLMNFLEFFCLDKKRQISLKFPYGVAKMTKLLKSIASGAGTFVLLPGPREATTKHYRPHESAHAALCSDWKKIGGDFRKVLAQSDRWYGEKK